MASVHVAVCITSLPAPRVGPPCLQGLVEGLYEQICFVRATWLRAGVVIKSNVVAHKPKAVVKHKVPWKLFCEAGSDILLGCGAPKFFEHFGHCHIEPVI